MWEAVKKARERYRELGELFADEKVIKDRSLLLKYSRERSGL
jgi:hypothetical protein